MQNSLLSYALRQKRLKNITPSFYTRRTLPAAHVACLLALVAHLHALQYSFLLDLVTTQRTTALWQILSFEFSRSDQIPLHFVYIQGAA